MVVGVCRLRLVFREIYSLKQKRSLVKRITGRVKSRFAVSIAEVGDNDVLRSSEVGICMVGNDRAFINSCLDKVIDFVDMLYVAEIVEQEIEIINL